MRRLLLLAALGLSVGCQQEQPQREVYVPPTPHQAYRPHSVRCVGTGASVTRPNAYGEGQPEFWTLNTGTTTTGMAEAIFPDDWFYKVPEAATPADNFHIEIEQFKDLPHVALIRIQKISGTTSRVVIVRPR